MAEPVIAAREVCLSYGHTPAVAQASLIVAAGETVALMGPSGSGKSSLLHCLAGVLPVDSGEVVVAGAPVHEMSPSRRTQHRLASMGMVFQFGALVPELTLLENVMLPLQLLGTRQRAAKTRSTEVLERLGVAEVADRRAGAVSGGQAQRAAVARALVHRPPVLFADEPTGALDSVTGEQVLDAMLASAGDFGTAIVLVSHDNRVAAHCGRLITMRDGILTAPTAARR